jgi:hypothetical protein
MFRAGSSRTYFYSRYLSADNSAYVTLGPSPVRRTAMGPLLLNHGPAVPDRHPEPGSRTTSPALPHSVTPALRHSDPTEPIAPLPPGSVTPPTAGSRDTTRLCESVSSARPPAVPDRHPEPGSRTTSPALPHSVTPALRHSVPTESIAPLPPGSVTPPTAGSRDTTRLCESASSSRPAPCVSGLGESSGS